MNHIKFKWDPKKDAINNAKHGVTFAEARSVFTDEHARLIPDPDHSEHEDRFILLGTSINSRLLVVCHSASSAGGGEVIRIISARKGSRRERRAYEEFKHA